MKTETIKVEGLPEGWKAVAHRKPLKEEYILYGDEICKPKGLMNRPWLIVEKIQPSRIVLEETWDECNYETTQEFKIGNNSIAVWSTKVLREVKETNIPLTNEEPYLKLTKKDMLELIEHIKLGGQLNHKIAEFIKENS